MLTFMSKIEAFFGRISRFFKKYPSLQFVLFGGMLSIIGFLPRSGLILYSTMGIYAYIVIFTVVALGLNILLGFSGLISLGTAGFIGAGALGVGIFMGYGLPFELAALITLIISGAFGALIGLFSLKVEGIYLAIATLFVGEILRQIYTQIPLFGGEATRILFRSGGEMHTGVRLFGFLELNQIFQQERMILYLILVVLMVLMMIVMYNIVHSRTGRALLSMSRSQHAAQAMGISLITYRLTAFVLATVFATFGGIMYALYFQNVPTRAWTLDISLFVIAMVVVGGFKSIFGTFLGVFIIHGVPNLWLKDLFGEISYIFSGVLIILVILFYPNGFVYIFVDLKKNYYKLKARLLKKRVKADD